MAGKLTQLEFSFEDVIGGIPVTAETVDLPNEAVFTTRSESRLQAGRRTKKRA